MIFLISSSTSSVEIFSILIACSIGMPFARACMTCWMSGFSICFLFRASRICSSWASVSFLDNGFCQSVSIFAIRFASLFIFRRVWKLSIVSGSAEIRLVSSSVKPLPFNSLRISVFSFGKDFFIWLICSLEIFKRGRSVSGYILALPGRGLRNFVVASGFAPLTSFFNSFFCMLFNCLSISFSITCTKIFGSWNPLISALGWPFMLTLMSCLIVPIPLLTFAALMISPIFNAVSLACSGVLMSGAVTISTIGSPSRSNLYVASSFDFFIILAASSSK